MRNLSVRSGRFFFLLCERRRVQEAMREVARVVVVALGVVVRVVGLGGTH